MVVPTEIVEGLLLTQGQWGLRYCISIKLNDVNVMLPTTLALYHLRDHASHSPTLSR